MSLVTIQSAAPGITLDEFIAHLRLEPLGDNPTPEEQAQNSLMQTYLTAAIQHVRQRCNAEVGVNGKYRLTTTLDSGGEVTLPNPPLVSVDEVKVDGVALSTGQYTVLEGQPAVVCIDRPGGAKVSISYTAGYPTADDVPDTLRVAILCVAAHLFENREATNVVELKPNPYIQNLLNYHTFYSIGEV